MLDINYQGGGTGKFVLQQLGERIKRGNESGGKDKSTSPKRGGQAQGPQAGISFMGGKSFEKLGGKKTWGEFGGMGKGKVGENRACQATKTYRKPGKGGQLRNFF